MNNQDLLRSTIHNLNTENLEKVFNWVNGKGEFPFPKSVHLNLTLRCSARCVHCNQWSWPTHKEFTIEQFQKIFSVFKIWGVQSITMGGGNPLMHPNIEEALDLSKKHNIKCGIITEGGEISTQLREKICNIANWVRFSIDGPSADIHDEIRNTPGLFVKATNNIKFIKEKFPHFNIGINCVIQKRNIYSLDAMFNLANSLKVDYLLFKLPHGDDPLNKYVPNSDEWKHIYSWIFEKSKIKYGKVLTNLKELEHLLNTTYSFEDLVSGKPTKSFYILNKVKCYTPFFFLTCDSEGYVYPCDYLQGDTRHWKGKYADMRNEFNLGNIIENEKEVMIKLESLMKNRIMNLPNIGYDECGSCTRFCQLNQSLSQLGSILRNEEINSLSINNALNRNEQSNNQINFL